MEVQGQRGRHEDGGPGKEMGVPWTCSCADRCAGVHPGVRLAQHAGGASDDVDFPYVHNVMGLRDVIVAGVGVQYEVTEVGVADPVGKIRGVQLDGGARGLDDQAGTAGGLEDGGALL